MFQNFIDFYFTEFTAVEWGNDIYEYPVHELIEINKDNQLQHVLINMFTGIQCVRKKAEQNLHI